MSIITNLIIIVLNFGFAFIFVAAEIALLQIKSNAIDPTHKYELYMAKHKSVFLSTIQVAITLANLFAGWAGEPAMTNIIKELIPMELPEVPLAIFSFALITYLSIVLTELLPKNIAMAYTQKTFHATSWPIHIVHIVFYPMVWLLDKSSASISKLLHIPIVNEQEDIYTQNVLISVARGSAKNINSDLTPSDAQYIENVVELDNKTVKSIMTPLNKISYDKSKFSRIPSQDMKSYSYRNKKYSLSTILAETSLNTAIHTMTEKKTGILAVVENGVIIGIITNSDIYAAVFGKIEDEKN